MKTINKKIFDWFNQGHIKEAIVGEKNYFIQDVTYREHHDRLLIFRQLFMWSDINNKALVAARSIEEILLTLSFSDKIADALDIFWCFLLTEEEFSNALPIDRGIIEKELVALVQKNTQELSGNYELRELVSALAGKLPNFKKGLNL